MVYDFKVTVGKRYEGFFKLTESQFCFGFNLNPYSTYQFLFVLMAHVHREVAVTVALFFIFSVPSMI